MKHRIDNKKDGKTRDFEFLKKKAQYLKKMLLLWEKNWIRDLQKDIRHEDSKIC